MKYRLHLLLAALLLTSCFGSEESAPQQTIRGPVSAVAWTLAVSRGSTIPSRPSALMGVFSTEFLSHSLTFRNRSAVQGVLAQSDLIYGVEGGGDDTYAVIQDLGVTLQVDINDMLNRSADRSKALDTYLEVLTAQGRRATLERDNVDQALDLAGDDRAEKRRHTGDIRRELSLALRDKDYPAAGTRQEQLTTAEAELHDAEGKERELRLKKDLLEDLLGFAEERLTAIRDNREVILAGLMVIETPGVDELGVIKESDRRGSRRGTSADVFGPIPEF